MLFEILKKDMLKRKGINIILFIFITLSTVFLASSVNNILVVSSGVSYYIDYADVPDINIVTNSTIEKDKITNWLEEIKADYKINSFDHEQFIILSDKALQIQRTGETAQAIDSKGASLYLSRMNVVSNKVYDLDGKSFSLQNGEIGIPISMADVNHLAVGDKLLIENNGQTKEFIVKVLTKDAGFGNEIMGMSRFVVSDEDYDNFQDMPKMGLYNINSEDVPQLTKLINAQSFQSVMNVVTLDMYQLAYSFDMIFAALLILIGICLILIALLVLRFTLVFTMEEQYQEIGILKAIGIRNNAIKKIYLIKYLLIVSLGALVGLLLSIPISNMMVKSVSYNMIMASSNTNIFVNIISAIAVVVLVLLFCYYCTHKLNKVSAISAIHNGNTGESFTPKHKLTLSNKKHMRVPVYLGLNDIFSHLGRYFILIITFCISFILITIPLNTLNTMRSKEMAEKFSLDVNSAAYLRMIEKPGEQKYDSIDQIKNRLVELEDEFEESGYDTSLKASIIYFMKFYSPGGEDKKNLLTTQIIGENNQFLKYSEGSAPLLENEIAISNDVLKAQGWQIGDSIYANFNGIEREFIITGTYSDYMQLGQSARLNPVIDGSKEIVYDYWAIMLDMETSLSQAEVVKEMKVQFPDYEWDTAQGLVNQNVGGIQDALATFLMPMTAMLCIIIMLITFLMEKMFIIREKGEIAMLKSIGFTYQTIRNWQLLRMLFVAVTAMLISFPISLLSNQFILRPIFKIMGADVMIQINPFQVYFLYPLILLLGIIIATIFTARGIKKINIREMNNIE